MDLTRVEDLRTALRLAGIRPNKSLGQHFLVDRPALETIMATAAPDHHDTVLEIGPGLGVMTRPLAEACGQLVAVEADHWLAELLRRDAPLNLEVVEGDILRFDVGSLPADYKVVANIPYYLTSRLFRLLLEAPNPPSVMSLLIQKEVAERIVAGPGKLNLLALSVQYYAEPELVMTVERYKFWPAPEVDSAVLKVTRRDKPRFEAKVDELFRLMKTGFSEKRKQLKNSLSGGLNLAPELAMRLLEQAQIEPMARAQELDWGAWERLYRVMVEETILE